MTHCLHRRALLGAAAALALPAAPARAQAAGAPLSHRARALPVAHALLAAFRPLREHLERALRRPVEMVTARDFRSQVEAVRSGEHDVGDAAGARGPAGDARLEVPAAGSDGRLGARAGAGAQRQPGAPGRRTCAASASACSDALSLTATVGAAVAARAGPGRRGGDRRRCPRSTARCIALDRGEVAVVVGAETQLRALPPEHAAQRRVLATAGEHPGPDLRRASPAARRADARRCAPPCCPSCPTRPGR